jgi:hypothetical protein
MEIGFEKKEEMFSKQLISEVRGLLDKGLNNKLRENIRNSLLMILWDSVAGISIRYYNY